MKNKKIYVITGSTSGIGKELLKELSVHNIVFAGYRNKNLKDDLQNLSSNIVPFEIDYAKPDTIKLAIDFIKSKVNKIDTLINVAGCVVAGPIEKIEISEIKRQFDVNVFGHLEFSKGLIDILQNGKIINVSSMASFGIFPFISPYCASKKCLDMFFNSLLIENKKNIKVVSIKPGVISTPLWSKSVDENAKYFEKFEDYKNEMEFVKNNALKNEKNGLNVSEVVKVILKADKSKNPLLSYVVGKDAFCAMLISMLPLALQNKLIKFGLYLKQKKRPCIK